MNEQWYNLKFKNGEGRTINFTDWTDWQKETIDTLNEHKNIKKVWLVNKQRKTGATYFAKLLMFFRPPCTNTFVISHNLFWSKAINRSPTFSINFLVSPCKTKNGEYYKASNFLTPVTLFGLEKEIEKSKETNEMLKILLEPFECSGPLNTSFECLYDAGFNVKTYKKLCSYDFDFFIVNVRRKI